jgi:pyroglutamyl-peptidase
MLPTEFGTSIEHLQQALARHRPSLVLALGVAPSRGAISVERVAINVDDARIADNAGRQPVDTPVVPGAPAAYFSTLPVKAMVDALQRAGWPAEVSHSAGTFVCNHVFFGLMHALRRRRTVRAGFVHLPPLDATAGPARVRPPLGAAVRLALATAIATTADLQGAVGGSID